MILVAENLFVFCRHYFGGYGFPWDFVNSYYAATAFWTQAAQHGSVPQWVPYQWYGYPLALNLQTGLFYPPLWLFPLLRVPYTLAAAVDLQCLHVLLGALGMYALLGVRLRSRRVALFGAFAYQFFGGFYSNAEHVDIVRAYALIPWLLYAASRRRSDGAAWPRRLLLLPVAVAFLATGGYPGNLFAGLFFLAVFLGLQHFEEDRGGTFRRAATAHSVAACLLVALGLAMAAGQLGPSVVYRGELARYHGAARVGIANLTLQHAPGLFLTSKWMYGDPSMASSYVGLPVLAGLLLLPRRRWRSQRTMLCLTALAILLVAGTRSPVYRLICTLLPPLGWSRFPSSDYRPWIAVGLISLAAAALQAIRRTGMPLHVMLLRWLPLGILFAWGLATVYSAHWSWKAVGAAVVCLAATLAALLLWRGRLRIHWRLALPVLLVVVAGDAGRVLLDLKTWAVPDLLGYCKTYYPVPAVLHELGLVVAPEVLRGVGGPRPARLEVGAYNYPSSGHLLGTFNAADNNGLVLETKRRIDATPWMKRFMLQEWTPLLLGPPTLRPEGSVGVEIPRPDVPAPGGASGVRQISYGLDRIRYEVELDRPALLVENESYFPGWTAQLSRLGELAALRVNGALRGWLLPAGRYAMEARFRLPGFRWLIAITAAAWVGLALASADVLLRRRGGAIQRAITAIRGRSGKLEAFRRMRSVAGRCNICGRRSRFYFDKPELYRESLNCEHCLSTSRYRSIARGVLRAIRDLTGTEVSSLTELAAVRPRRRIVVYDTQAPFRFEPAPCAYPIPEMLARCDWIDVQISVYRPREPWGAALGPGITNQNIERLTFPDASFDIVITSDVMEHVRLPDAAHRQILRVLRPRGAYVFTVPCFWDRPTRRRVDTPDLDDPTKDVYVLPRDYHGDANSEEARALVYSEFGLDLEDALRCLGFEVEYTRQDLPDVGILNTELFYCRVPAAVATKRAEPEETGLYR